MRKEEKKTNGFTIFNSTDDEHRYYYTVKTEFQTSMFLEKN